MQFDRARRKFIDPSGRTVSPTEVRKEINGFIQSEQFEVAKQSQRLIDGEISADEFFGFMRERVTAWHGITGVISYGGEDQMNAERWGRINEKIASQLEFLDGFQQATEDSLAASQAIADQVASQFPDAEAEIRERISQALLTAAPSETEDIVAQVVTEVTGDAPGVLDLGGFADSLIGGTIESRAESYADSMWATFETQTMRREQDEGVNLGRRICEQDGASCEECVTAATEEFIPLDDIEEIGSLQCLNNCRCEIEFSVGGIEFATSDLFSGVIGGQEKYGGSIEIQ